MDKTIRTIRKTITEAKNGIVPAIVLIVDTNILADIGWSRDQNAIHLIEYAARVPMVFVCCPGISAIEFKMITQTEVKSLKKFREDFDRVFHEIKRYEIENVDKIVEGFSMSRRYFDELISKLRQAPLHVLDKLAPVLYIFDYPLPIQHTMAYYVSNDPEYNLQYKDALVFSFSRLVGKSIGYESKVIFLTKDMDFSTEKIRGELDDAGVEVYFSSGECLRRVRDLLA